MQIQQLAGQIPYAATRTSREFMCASRELFPPFVPEQGIWREIDPCARTGVAGGRSVRVQASIARAEPVDSSEALAGFFPSHGRGGPHSPAEEKAIEALGNPDSGFTKIT
jgi:hypothetical protein